MGRSCTFLLHHCPLCTAIQCWRGLNPWRRRRRSARKGGTRNLGPQDLLRDPCFCGWSESPDRGWLRRSGTPMTGGLAFMKPITVIYTFQSDGWQASATVTDFGDRRDLIVRGDDAVPAHLREEFDRWLLQLQQRCCSTKPTIVTTSSAVVEFIPLGLDRMECRLVRGSLPMPVGVPIQMRS